MTLRPPTLLQQHAKKRQKSRDKARVMACSVEAKKNGAYQKAEAHMTSSYSSFGSDADGSDGATATGEIAVTETQPYTSP